MKSEMCFSNFLGAKERVRKTEGNKEEREEGRERKGEMNGVQRHLLSSGGSLLPLRAPS